MFPGDRYLNKEKLLTGILLGQKAPFPCRSFPAGFANESSGGILLCNEGTGKNLPFSFYNSGTGSTNKRKESGDGSARTIYCCFGTDTKTLSGTMVQLLSILGTCRKAVTGFKRETKRCNRINMTKNR